METLKFVPVCKNLNDLFSLEFCSYDFNASVLPTLRFQILQKDSYYLINIFGRESLYLDMSTKKFEVIGSLIENFLNTHTLCKGITTFKNQTFDLVTYKNGADGKEKKKLKNKN
jgi:hypothetical protein